MGKFKLKITKKKMFAIGGVVLLLIAALGAGFLVWWLQHKDVTSNTNAPLSPFDEFQKKSFTPNTDKAQRLALGGKVDESNQLIKDTLANPATGTDERYQLMLQEGLNYANAGNHTKALEVYLETEKVKSNFNMSHLIGEEYEALGNNTQAVTYFKKAISQLDSTAISYQSDKDYYEAKIKELGGQL